MASSLYEERHQDSQSQEKSTYQADLAFILLHEPSVKLIEQTDKKRAA